MAKGRPKGSRNKSRQALYDKADELGIDPFVILLHIANADWKALGYDSEFVTRITKDGKAVDVDRIELHHRLNAAKECCTYMYPKLKAIEHTGENGKPLFEPLSEKEIMDAIRNDPFRKKVNESNN